MTYSNKRKPSQLLLVATALSTGLIAFGAQAQDCADPYSVVPQDCEQPNRGTVVDMNAEPNTEFDEGRVDNDAGFVIAIDGEPLNSDPRIEDNIRRTDIALARADVQVKFDGLGAKPRLDLVVDEIRSGRLPGERVTLHSRMNYPAFISRAEVRVWDISNTRRPELKGVIPIDPNGVASLTLPEGGDLVAVHRVYDKHGRYDETNPISLTNPDGRGLVSFAEEGTDATATRNIPVSGGAITVFSDNVAPGSIVRTLGEVIRPNAEGKFVIQRIYPAGEYDVDVAVNNGSNVQFSREVEIPTSEWFYTGIADATLGLRNEANGSGNELYSLGRVGFYVKGKTDSGLNITASVDTGEDEIKNIFRNLDEKDPRSVLQRVDPDDTYAVYGDDSTIFDDTPTDGKLYAKVEKDGNFALWGNYKASIIGNKHLRNERSLYGAQAVWKSREQTPDGNARRSLQAYASQPDTLPGRDVFQGTGGSIYFLQRQDLNIGSETLTVEVRDPVSGLVIDRQTLVRDVDYKISYIQGTITLTKPLNSTQNGGVISATPSNAQQVNLVAQYEYSPTLGSLDGFSYGARGEAWVSDNLRLGATLLSESTGTADQKAVGGDILYAFGEDSFARVDVARTNGPGFGSSFSTDGGLIINNATTATGSGTSVRAEAEVDFTDMSLPYEGAAGLYIERRGEGFASLDNQVTAATGDEDLWGAHANGTTSSGLGWAVSHDNYSNQVGDFRRTTQAELGFQGSGDLRFDVGADFVESGTATTSGNRVDVGGRLTYTPNENREYWAFAQGTVSNSGLEDNNKYGVGARVKLTETWTGEAEIYDSTAGLGGRALIEHQNANNDSLYFGYEREAGRTLGNTTLRGDDDGRLVMGGRRQVSERTEIFAENTYDLFGEHRSLTSAYGISYAPDVHSSYDVAVEFGQINDVTDGDFDRTAFSFGTTYQREKLTARAKAELRHERGTTAGTNRDADTILLSASARYEIDDNRRLLGSIAVANTNTDQSSILDGSIADVSIGYAVRPVTNDKLNLLFKYRYLYDLYGQQIDGTAGTGIRQKSHVLSVDASYDLNPHWTVGGKFGVRLAQTAPNATASFTKNNAVLAVANVRYHVTHNWDVVAEARVLDSQGADGTETGLLIAGYRHIGNNIKFGIGYNFGRFTDNLTNFSTNNRGPFINFVAKF